MTSKAHTTSFYVFDHIEYLAGRKKPNCNVLIVNVLKIAHRTHWSSATDGHLARRQHCGISSGRRNTEIVEMFCHRSRQEKVCCQVQDTSCRIINNEAKHQIVSLHVWRRHLWDGLLVVLRKKGQFAESEMIYILVHVRWSTCVF